MRQLTKTEFMALHHPESPEISSMAHAFQERTRELEWWADDDKRIIGTVVHDIPDADYTAVTLVLDQNGVFYTIDAQQSVPTQGEASIKLQEKIAELAATGQSVFRRDE
jgi:hypothetical protein